MEITRIEQPIKPLLDRYNATCQELTQSDVRLINDVTQHVLSDRGKQIRPLLTLLSAACCGLPIDAPSRHPIFRAAAAIELIHNASLLHDDVIDESALRRGHTTVNQLWSNKVAVLMGDYYLSHVMRILFDIDNQAVTSLVNQAVIQMCEGEMLQQQCCGDLNTTIDTYTRIIRQKTAVLLSACCEIGALLTTDDSAMQASAAQFGLQLGIAFQIRDDLLDLMPSAATGKPQGNDLREGRITLPLILANKKNPICNNISIATLLQNKLTDHDIQNLINHIASSGAMEEAVRIQQSYIDSALTHLHQLPASPYRDALADLANQLKTINPITNNANN